MKRTDLAYVAGIIDGEGCIDVNRRNRPSHKYPDTSLRVTVVSTDQWLCQMLRFSFGGAVRERIVDKLHQLPQWDWRIERGKASEFLKLILPYLHLKKPQAELGIKFQEAKGRSTHGLTDKERAVEEAQRILLQTMKRSHMGGYQG